MLFLPLIRIYHLIVKSSLLFSQSYCVRTFVCSNNCEQLPTNLPLLCSEIRIAGYSERFWKETRTRIPLVAGAEQSVRLLGSRYLAAGRAEEDGEQTRSVDSDGEGVGVLAPETGEYRGNELCRIPWRSLSTSLAFALCSIRPSFL